MTFFLRSIVPGKSRRTIATGIIFVLLVVAGFVAATLPYFRKLYQSRSDYEGEERRLRMTQNEVERWRQRKESLETSAFEREKRLRELMMLKPSEKMILIKPTPEEKDE